MKNFTLLSDQVSIAMKLYSFVPCNKTWKYQGNGQEELFRLWLVLVIRLQKINYSAFKSHKKLTTKIANKAINHHKIIYILKADLLKEMNFF